MITCTHRAIGEAGPQFIAQNVKEFNGTTRTMLALRSAAALGNVRIQCVRVLVPPRSFTTAARAYWQQAAVRPGPSYRRPRAEWSTSGASSWPSQIFPHHCPPLRLVTPHPRRLFRHLAAQDAKSAPQSSTTAANTAAAGGGGGGGGVNSTPQPTTTSKATVSNAEQRRRDWSIVRRLLVHIWPKDDWGTRGRVVLGVGLLICGKVRLSSLPPSDFREIVVEQMFVGLQLLNVQVPLFFKEVIDTLNIPIDSQSTVWVVCGSVILACMWSLYLLCVFGLIVRGEDRWRCPHRRNAIWRAVKRCVC